MRIWVFLATILLAVAAIADDGTLFRKDVSKTADLETEHAGIGNMAFYVPAQSSDGTLLDGIDYLNAEGAVVETRTVAKPLISVYIDGHVEHVEGTGFAGHGMRDGFAAVSLDDGATWKRTNLSRSADRSSITVLVPKDKNKNKDKVKKPKVPYDYPGDVINVTSAVAGNKVIVAWPSRYCTGGNPAYAMDDETKAAVVAYLGLGEYDLYVDDIFGVAGSQGFIDFADEEYPEVGQVPFSCLWAARGTLELDETTGLHALVWRNAERLTSGVRDVNRVEVAMAANGGAVVVWQEDPKGLRPGQGLGPGEGWSGAIANHQTDIWYSWIGWDEFDIVEAEDGSLIPYSEYTGETAPKAGIPMAVPVRATDNAKCNVDNPKPYCDYETASLYGLKDYCVDTVLAGGKAKSPACVTEDGLVLVGNTASTRPRVALYAYTRADGSSSAWVVFASEESKGMGAFFFDDDGNPCTEGAEGCQVADDGKNIWYYTFDMREPEVVSHGNLLNQPEMNWETGDFYPVLNTSQMWEFGAYDHEIYRTEIARRFSLMSQSAAKAQASVDNGGAGLTAFPMYKQGILNQGGPADVYGRRIVLPEGFDPAVDNPYAFENMACESWLYDDGSNPYYPKGLCLDTPVNLSGVVPATCEDSSTGGGVTCPTVTDGIGDTDPADKTLTIKTLTWYQCPGSELCDAADSTLDDQSWENPLDVSKGHRGFIDGDFVMVLYAWSPNWKLNSRGHDRYELYIRRSFDGGQTWTTTPAGFQHIDGMSYPGDGTVTCETFRAAAGETEAPVLCTDYAAGSPEQARNVSQLGVIRLTILDPRYTPTPGSIVAPATADGFQYPDFPDDTRNPSRYYIVYETGDNTTVSEGEATPLDLFYSRAVGFGDDYQVWAEEGDTTTCLPSADTESPFAGSGFCNEWDDLEGRRDRLSGEAALKTNPDGSKLYAVWNQWEENEAGETLESDAWFRRVWYIDGYVPPLP